MLNPKDFTTALEIISKHHSTELAINTPKDNFELGWDCINLCG